MKTRGPGGAFSLVEVVVAIAIFSGTVVVALALLPSLLRQTVESSDLQVAQGLPDAVRVELRRLATRNGFDGLAGAIPVWASEGSGGFGLVAGRSGIPVTPAAESSTVLRPGDEFFAIEVWRYSEAPLAFVSGDAVLAVQVRVSWPHRVTGSVEAVPQPARRELRFSAAINR